MELVGRDDERALIDALLDDARAGRGRALFVTGEAGIGKSSVLREARRRADGFTVLSGAAWEAGGAPPYWPWLEVMRDAGASALPGAARCGELAASSASWGAGVEPGSDASAARFAVVDSLARALAGLAAGGTPVLVLLDDLHAADVPSLDVLMLVARELPRARIAIVAGYREAELGSRPDVATRIARAARHATVRSLRRLTRSEVAAWTRSERADALFAASEGNPLFVEELLRARGATRAPGIASAIREHVALAAPATIAVLQAASVLGRTFDEATLRAIAPGAIVDAALRDGADCALVTERDGRWTFGHVLVRDELYASLAPARRAELHRAAGEVFDRADPTGVRAAHHALAGGTAGAIAIARRAAERAWAIYAFEDAAALLDVAIRTASGAEAADLLVDLSRARHACGDQIGAQAAAVRAAAIARELGDPERLARAALIYGHELTSGRRDATMIALLDEARAGLGASSDRALAIRVTARLAAALMPSPDTTRPFALAREAVAAARELGDRDTLLHALRFRMHAEGFLVRLDEHLEASAEVVALATEVGRPLEALEIRTWRVFAQLALGDAAAATVEADELFALLARVPQPQYRWRAPLLRASLAAARGRFDDAARDLGVVQVIVDEHELPRARLSLALARLTFLSISGRDDAVEPALEAARIILREVDNIYTGGMMAYVLVRAGRADEARAHLEPRSITPAAMITQVTAQAAMALGDRDICERALVSLQSAVTRHAMPGGPSGSVIQCPTDIAIGELLIALGRAGEARAPIERGLALARAIDARPFVDRAEAALAAIGIAKPAPVAMPGEMTLTREGDLVRVRWNGAEHVVASSKGMDYLAALAALPGRAIHVSDLTGDEDRGDAGDVLDAPARAAYRARAEDLREELDGARARNDLGRIERLSAELDAIADQLVAATGLGGRARKAGSRVERARVNVQRRLRDAIRRLAEVDTGLGKHLDLAVRTGTFCTYSPG